MKRFMDLKVVAVLVVVFLLGSALAATYAQGGTVPSGNTPNTITVTGSGQASGAPDVANVDLGITVTDPDPSKALTQANEVIDKVTAAIQATGIAAADIQTRGFNLYPQQVESTGASSQSSTSANAQTYQAQIIVSVRVKDISKIGAVIDAGTKAGANTISGLSFGIDDPAKLEQQARVLAVANAHERAQQLATILNMTLGDPVSISESTGGGSVPIAYSAVGGAMAKISTGQLNVGVDVQITYSMTKK